MSADNIGRLFDALIDAWPAHRKHLERTLAAWSPQDRAHAEVASGLALRIAGDDLERICHDYAWLCGQMQEEQIHFARTGSYRLSNFKEAQERVYDNAPFMERYLNGLLVGRITWLDQLRMLGFYRDKFLPENPLSYDHLEVGAGHGLLLYFAAMEERCAAAAGMDVSRSSLLATGRCMERLGSSRVPDLIAHDVLSGELSGERRWDSIVVSEVLEHLEEPAQALQNMVGWLRPGGRIYITTPANSPMPDHIHLFRSPEEVLDLITKAGLSIIEQRFFTGLGLTEDKARRRQMPISCAVIACLPEDNGGTGKGRDS